MLSEPKAKTLVAYVASPHAGYLELFRTYQGGELWIFGKDFIKEHTSLVRHLPGNDPYDACIMIISLGIFERVRVLELENLRELFGKAIIMPDEDVSRLIAEKYFPQEEVTFDGRWKLRWDWNTTVHQKKPEGDIVISADELDRRLMESAFAEGKRSPDWWRQIGALLVRDGKPLLVAFNTHFPTDQAAYLMGDPRSNFGPGQHIDSTLSLHAEVGIISAAAKRGLATEGCDLYCTTFPCPPCANAVANSGIRRLFYAEGYSLVAGADSLRSRGVEIIRVEMNNPPTSL